MSNSLEAFNKNPRKNPVAGMIKGEEMGKGFTKYVQEAIGQAKETLIKQQPFSIMIRSHVKAYEACTTNEERQTLGKKIARINDKFIPQHIPNDEMDRAAYCIALLQLIREQSARPN